MYDEMVEIKIEGFTEAKNPPRYTVVYKGSLFYGDNDDGWNFHDYDHWEDVQNLINTYGDIIEVVDNEYDTHWKNGEWY